MERLFKLIENRKFILFCVVFQIVFFLSIKVYNKNRKTVHQTTKTLSR